MGYVTQTCLEAPHSSNTLCFVIQVRIISYMATLYKRLIVCSKIFWTFTQEQTHNTSEWQADLVHLQHSVTHRAHPAYIPSVLFPHPHKAYSGLCAVRLSSINAKKSMCNRGNALSDAVQCESLLARWYPWSPRRTSADLWHQANENSSEGGGEGGTRVFSTLTPSEGPGAPLWSSVSTDPDWSNKFQPWTPSLHYAA